MDKNIKKIGIKDLNKCSECGKEKVRLLNGRVFCLICRIAEIKKNQEKGSK